MKNQLILLLSILFLAAAASNFCFADMLLFSGEQDPIFGLSVKSSPSNDTDTSNVEFSVYDATNKTYENHSFARRDIKSIVVSVDQTRLENLDTKNLNEIRDLAEELASHTGDPVARAIATRLAMICIFHGSKEATNGSLVTSASRTLLQLADTPKTRKQYELLAMVYSDSEPPSSPVIPANQESSDDNEFELAVLQSIRREKFDLAKQLLDKIAAIESSPVRFELEPAVRQAIKAQQFSTEFRRRLLEREIQIRFGLDPPSSNHPSMFSFSREKKSNSVHHWRIEHVAGFDLEATVFKDGRWHRPTKIRNTQ